MSPGGRSRGLKPRSEVVPFAWAKAPAYLRSNGKCNGKDKDKCKCMGKDKDKGKGKDKDKDKCKCMGKDKGRSDRKVPGAKAPFGGGSLCLG